MQPTEVVAITMFKVASYANERPSPMDSKKKRPKFSHLEDEWSRTTASVGFGLSGFRPSQGLTLTQKTLHRLFDDLSLIHI